MKRRTLIILPAILSMTVLVQAQAEFTLTPVTGQVYMLQGDGGNIGVLADPAGILLIDSMYQRSADSIREAVKSAVCKVNIDSDGRLAMTAAIRKHLKEHPEDFDPRKYLGPPREGLKELYKHKCVNVLNSAGKAW